MLCWRNKQQLDQYKIPSDGVPIGSGILAGITIWSPGQSKVMQILRTACTVLFWPVDRSGLSQSVWKRKAMMLLKTLQKVSIYLERLFIYLSEATSQLQWGKHFFCSAASSRDFYEKSTTF